MRKSQYQHCGGLLYRPFTGFRDNALYKMHYIKITQIPMINIYNTGCDHLAGKVATIFSDI